MRTCLLCECTSLGTMVRFQRPHICTDCERSLARSGRVWCMTGKHAVPKSLSNADRCKACDAKRNKAGYKGRAEEARAYRENNRAKMRAYYARPDVLARRAAWQRADYAKNPARYHARYRRHAAYKRAYSRRRYWSNPVYWRAVSRRYQAQRRDAHKLAILRAWRGR
jgi:hypothetical protein